MTNDVAVSEQYADLDTFAPASVFDVARFEQVMRVADVMARATTLPEHLKSRSEDRNERFEETRGNCFMICNQADHWGMDPFSVAQATAFVYGKIVYEGKLIRAVIKKKLGFDLNYSFFGRAGDMQRTVYVCDKPLVGDDQQPLTQEIIEEMMRVPSNRITKGTLEKWHTKSKGGGVNDNWVKDEDKMFRERGSREWCRQWAPGLMLGVYTPDEFDELEHSSRSARARDVTDRSSNPLLDHSPAVAMERIDPETGELIPSNSEASGRERRPAHASGSTRAAARASERPDRPSGRETGSAPEGQSPTNSSSSSQDGEGGAGAESPRFPAGTFSNYSAALLRFSSADNIEKAHEEFWSKNEQGKPTNPADLNLGKSIKSMHLSRVKGERPIEQLKTDVENAIKTSFEGL